MIARHAGVGTATVERVLNSRGGVRPDVVDRVVASARALDYPRRLPDAHRGIIRIEVILVRPETTFFARLSRAFERIAATLDRTIAVHRTFVAELDANAIAARIRSPGMRRAGLILAVPDDPLVRDALRQIETEKTPVIEIVTRIAGKPAAYVGIDNYAAGRSAALYLSRMQRRSGKVAAICHSQIYQVHRDRIRGFSDYLAEHPRGDLAFTEVMFGKDLRHVSAELLVDALARWPDLVGLYNAGGANSGLCGVLRRHPRGREIFFVGHELTQFTEPALRDGIMDVVIDQAPEAQARRAIDLMLARLGFLEMPVDNPPVRFVTYTSESV